MKSIIVSVLVLLNIFLGFSHGKVCLSNECKETAKRIKSWMDLSQDPCQDFYLYSCGNFKNQYPLPTGVGFVESIALVAHNLVKQIHGLLLDDNLKNHGSQVVRESKQMFDDCMKKDDNLTDSNVFKSMVDKIDMCQHPLEFKYPAVLSRLYVDKYFNVQEYQEAKNTILAVKKAVESLNIKWTSIETRETIKNHLNTMQYNIGRPDWIINDKELDDEYNGKKHEAWQVKVRQANTAYVYWGKESLYIPAGILHYNIFNRKHPKALNYGAAGIIAGHEISHGIDHWMSFQEEDVKTLESHVKCLIKQLETVKEPQTGSQYKNASGLRNESLADVGALNPSYLAYKQYMNGKEDESLPGLDLTPDQLFFVSQAHLYCFNADDDLIKSHMKHGYGNPFPYFRVVLPVINSPSFAKVFKCETGRPMNPVKKCDLW